jgi:PAS domain S-box-containing protein
MSLSARLERLGYGIAGIAVRGEEAVEMALRLDPLLILMDIQLRGEMDGIQAIEAIRGRRDIPFIYLTAHSDPATLRRAKATRPSGIILKPFEERELETQIELALYRHETDRRLREQREMLRVTLSSIGDAVITTDTAGRITFCNPAAETLTGWRSQEAQGRPVGDILRIVDVRGGDIGESPVSMVIRTGATVAASDDRILIRKDGRNLSINSSGAPIRDEKGDLLGVVLVLRDITARKEAENALLESEQRLRLFVEHAPVALAMFDRDMRYLVASRRWLADYGVGGRELAGLSHYEVFPEIPERWKEVHRLALGGEVIRAEADRFDRADGSVQWVRWEVRPWRDRSGRIAGTMIYAEDITELRRSLRGE